MTWINIKHRLAALALCLFALCLHGWGQWVPDTLGHGFEMRYIDQGTDYSGPVRCTLVRKLAPCHTRRGVLYVHGYNDYFFQREMADKFVDSCYNFYAVDLRKYGRSIMPGQHKFEARDLSEYFADIDSALADMKQAGISDVVLIGHSTGGLITALFMAEHPSPMVRELILNSPFLEWNKSAFMRNVAIPAVSAIGESNPGFLISNGSSTAYGESLLATHHGEWEYNTEWKTLYPEKVSAGWIRAIDRAHHRLRKSAGIGVPILLMHSSASVHGDVWTQDFQHGDAVLDVDQISKYGRMLGPNITEVTVPGGLHDLVLSAPNVRNAVYNAMFKWLDRQ